MDAFLFSFALFAVLLLVGAAISVTFISDSDPVKLILMSPGVGLATIILPLFLLSRAGLPVKTFGMPYAAIIIFASAASFLPIQRRRRIQFDWPVMAIICCGLLLSGRPMLRFGFDWIGFANDDMANYCLAAQRYFEHGYFAPPDIKGFLQGSNFDAPYWFMYVLGHARAGSELLLAGVWAATGTNPQLAFMPTIYALFAALLCATAGLVWDREQPIRARAAAALLALSPMTNLGAYYQLIAQFGGLTLLVVTFDQLCPATLTRVLLGRSLIAGVSVAGLMIVYPEVTPFLIASSALWFAMTCYRGLKRSEWIAVTKFWGLSALAASVTLNVAAIELLQFLLQQVLHGTKGATLEASLFPYFLVPSGLPALWGLIPIAAYVPEPWLSCSIVAGIVVILLFCATLLHRVIQPRRVEPWILMSGLMVAAGLLLFLRHNDFGLFKLVMFAQPFLMASMASLVPLALRPARTARTLIGWSIGAVLLAPVIMSHEYYVRRSECTSAGSFCQLPGASQSRLLSHLQSEFPKLPRELVALHTNNVVFAKLEQLHALGRTILFPANQFGRQLIEGAAAHAPRTVDGLLVDPNLQLYFRERDRSFIRREVATADGPNSFLVPAAYTPSQRHDEPVSSRDLAPFNHYPLLPENSDGAHQPLARPTLLYVTSARGRHFYDFNDPATVSFYGLESDPMFPSRTMAAFGRHMLFEAAGAESPTRCVIEMSATLAKQFGSALPDVRVNGLRLGALGRGSARVFSEPIMLDTQGKIQYLSLDLGRAGKAMAQHRTGLMNLYGGEVRADRRQMTVFGRDVSLLSDQAYQQLQPPASIGHFPRDLGDSNLEYSGIYEDGWIAESTFVRLRGGDAARFVHLNGMLPVIGDPDFTTTATILVDGRLVGAQTLHPGAFELKFSVAGVAEHARIDVHFSRVQNLPSPDDRPAAVHLSIIGFSPT